MTKLGKKIDKPKCNFIIVPDFSEEDLKSREKDWVKKGNIPAAIELILHNQFIINTKLNRLLEKK